MEPICEVVITAPEADWLRDFSKSLVVERFAACGHSIAEIRSIYRWEGQVHDKLEARVMLHTRQSLVAEIIEVTRREHPFEVPCVIATPVTEANLEYHAWVIEETRAPARR